MVNRAAEMRSQGVNVINLSVGEPDFNTPDHIRRAAKEAMDNGFTKYTSGQGMLEFREAICNKLKQENGIEYTPGNILVSNGEKQSLYNVCQALFDADDKVVVFAPYWVSFPEFVRLSNAEPLIINTLSNKNYEPDFNDLALKVDPQAFIDKFDTSIDNLDELVKAKSVTIQNLLEILPPGTPDPTSQVYNKTMIVMACLLGIALIANFLVKAVDSKHHMKN